MHGLRRLLVRHHHLFLAIAVIALAVRALVPGGWMVAAGADGLPRLTLCSGTGAIDLRAAARAAAAMARAMPGMHHGTDRDGAPSHPDHPCAFSGAGLVSYLPSLDLPPALAPLAAPAPRLVILLAAIGHGLAAPPPPPTGPPAFA